MISVRKRYLAKEQRIQKANIQESMEDRFQRINILKSGKQTTTAPPLNITEYTGKKKKGPSPSDFDLQREGIRSEHISTSLDFAFHFVKSTSHDSKSLPAWTGFNILSLGH